MAEINRVSFVLDSLPGSVNEIYCWTRSIYRPRDVWDIKAEWKIWRSDQGPNIPYFTITDTSIVRVDRCYYYNWYYKNGNFKKVDTANMDKLLFDTIAKKIKVDDSRFKLGMMDSIHDEEDRRVEVTLTEVVEAEWRAR